MTACFREDAASAAQRTVANHRVSIFCNGCILGSDGTSEAISVAVNCSDEVASTARGLELAPKTRDVSVNGPVGHVHCAAVDDIHDLSAAHGFSCAAHKGHEQLEFRGS